MNRLESYRTRYRDAREAVLGKPSVDLMLLDEVARGADIPVDALLTVDERDRELQERLQSESVTRLLGYFAVNEDIRATVFDALSPYDSAPRPGALFVYGAGGNARPRQAAALYARARQPVIVSDADPAVRHRFAHILHENGVDSADIVFDDKARNYLENARFSFGVLAERYPEVDSVTVVTESIVALRALVATRMFAPGLIAIASHPMLTDPDDPDGDVTAPQNWYASELGMKLLLGEIIGFTLYRRFGLIDAV